MFELERSPNKFDDFRGGREGGSSSNNEDDFSPPKSKEDGERLRPPRPPNPNRVEVELLLNESMSDDSVLVPWPTIFTS